MGLFLILIILINIFCSNLFQKIPKKKKKKKLIYILIIFIIAFTYMGATKLILVY